MDHSLFLPMRGKREDLRYEKMANIMEKLLKDESPLSTYRSTQDGHFKTSDGFVAVDREFNIWTERPPELPAIELSQQQLRVLINDICFSKQKEQDCDLQFDGSGFSDGPKLPEESVLEEDLLKAYKKAKKIFAKDEKKLASILEKLGAETASDALCKAAEKNDKKAPSFFNRKSWRRYQSAQFREWSNSLELAKERKHAKIEHILLRHGAVMPPKESDRDKELNTAINQISLLEIGRDDKYQELVHNLMANGNSPPKGGDLSPR